MNTGEPCNKMEAEQMIDKDRDGTIDYEDINVFKCFTFQTLTTL